MSVRAAGLRVASAARSTLADCLSAIQVAAGREPTVIRSSRAALEQWRFALTRSAETCRSKRESVAVFALRNETWIEWGVFACHYLRTMGYSPTLVFARSEIGRVYGRTERSRGAGYGFWHAVERLDYLRRTDLDAWLDRPDRKEDAYFEWAQRQAGSVAAYDLRVEEDEEDVLPDRYRQHRADSQHMLQRYAAATERLLRDRNFARVICPSGLIDKSPAVLEAARRRSCPVACVEGWAMRPGHMIVALDRPALFYDAAGWIERMGAWDAEKESDAADFRRFQERSTVERRDDWLRDFHPVQTVDGTAALSPQLREFLTSTTPLFVLCCNVVGDSATLRTQTIFRNQKEWLRAVIAFFARHPEWRLIIRTHPDERWARARVRLGAIAKPLAEGHSNVRVVGSEEAISTYSLVDRADVILAWVSNVGVDAVIRGKPTIVAASPKYSGLGIVEEPSGRDGYFDCIARHAAHPTAPSPDAIARAKAFQRVVFKEMSFHACGNRYVAAQLRLPRNCDGSDSQRRFFELLAGERDEFGRHH